MSTRDLSRTVIEGGRTGFYKRECDRYIREERAQRRTYLRNLILDPSLHDDGDELPPVRRPSNVDFKDKTHPIYRFLDSHVGESWNTTRSELFKKFDTRTTPGRHVLYDHLLRDVCEIWGSEEGSPERRFARYHVDAQGLLQKDDWDSWHGTRPKRVPHCDLRVVAQWLGHHKVGRCGGSGGGDGGGRGERQQTFALFAPVTKESPPLVRAVTDDYYGYSGYSGYSPHGKIVYAVIDDVGRVVRDSAFIDQGKYSHTRITIRISQLSFRQARMLTKDETAYFLSLPQHVRDMVLAHAPTSV